MQAQDKDEMKDIQLMPIPRLPVKQHRTVLQIEMIKKLILFFSPSITDRYCSWVTEEIN